MKFVVALLAATLLAASMVVMTLEPAPARAAAPRSEAHFALSTTSSDNPANVVVLAPGSGYSSPTDTARVAALQRRLVAAGYWPGPIDGRYGPLTEQAVARFQAAHGLAVDGIAGPVTLAAMSTPWAFLYPGSGYRGQGSQSVRALQRRLAGDRYSPGPIDGRYGPQTEQAVARLQAAHGLVADGIVGSRTFAALGKASRPQYRNAQPEAPSRPNAPSHPKAPSGVAPGSRPQASPSSATHKTPAGAMVSHHQPGGSHAAGSASAELLALLAALGLAALGSGLWLSARRQRAQRLVVASETRVLIDRKPEADLGGGQPGTALVTDPDAQTTAREPDVMDAGAPVTDRNHVVAAPGESGVDLPDEREAPAGREHPTVASESGSAKVPEPAALDERRGDITSAESAYRNADANGDAVAASILGLVLERRGDLAGAEAAYRRAAARGYSNGAFNLAGLLAQRGDIEGAMDAYRLAGKRGDAGAAANLGVLLEHQGDVKGAFAAFRRADERGHAGATTNLGVFLERRGDMAGAEAAYRRADERGDANGAFNLGGLLAERGDYAAAAEAYHRANERGAPAAASNLGVLLERAGDLTGAAHAYRRAEQRGHATGAFNLGMLLERQDDRRGALRAYERAGQLGEPEIAHMARARARGLSWTINGPTGAENGGAQDPD